MRIYAVLLIIITAAPNASGELNFCNGSPLTIDTAVAYSAGAQWFTSGWYTADPGECIVVLGGALNARYYYAYAQTSGDRFEWNGDMSMCAPENAFTIRHPECSPESMHPFTKFDTGDSAAFDYWFTCPDCIDQRIINAIRPYLPYVEQVANEQAPLSYQTPDWQDIGPVDIMYGVSRGPFSVGLDGNRISVSTHVSYWLSVSNVIPIFGRNGLASCGVDESEPGIDVTLESIVGVKPDGHLHSKTRITNLAFPDPCNLTFLNIDVRSYVEGVVRPQLERVTSVVDAQLATVDVSPVLKVVDVYRKD